MTSLCILLLFCLVMTSAISSSQANQAAKTEAVNKALKTCDYTYGCGSVSYPGQCDKFIQCYEKKKEEYQIQSCPSGLQWDARAKTCNYPWAAKCAKDSCQMKWTNVLKTNKNGKVISGNKAALQKAVQTGARIKLVMSTYSAEFQNCKKIQKDVCCQALHHIGFKNWEEFKSKAYVWLINVCTTGHFHIIRYYVGGKFLSQTKKTDIITWFVLKDKTGIDRQPVYSTAKDGSVTRGSINSLVQAVKQGKSVSVVTNHNAVFPIQNIELYADKIVSAQHVWSASQRKVGNHLEYQDNAYWWFLVLTTMGTRDMSRWDFGSLKSRGHTSDKPASMDWFVDECWNEAYCSKNHGAKGVRYLIQLVNSGHRVSVKFGNTIMEATSIRLTKCHLSAQFIFSLPRANASSFEEDLNFEFRIIGTTGTVRTFRPLASSSKSPGSGTSVQKKDLVWFVDTKKWILLFHIDKNGSVITGSAIAVREAVVKGADIRVGYRLTGDPGFRYSEADNVKLGPKPHVSAQLIRLLSDHLVSNTEFTLDKKPHYSFRLVTTKGHVRTSEWQVGGHVNRARTMEKADLKWFASF